jgi:hypothetical protein
VFLRHTAPVGPFSDQDHLHQTLVRHARAAHVPLGDDQDAPLVSHPVEYLADRAVRDDLRERGQPDVRC